MQHTKAAYVGRLLSALTGLISLVACNQAAPPGSPPPPTVTVSKPEEKLVENWLRVELINQILGRVKQERHPSADFADELVLVANTDGWTPLLHLDGKDGRSGRPSRRHDREAVDWRDLRAFRL